MATTVTVSNVADIFSAAGYAFKKLSELIQLMDNQATSDGFTTSAAVTAENGDTSTAAAAAATGFNSHWDAADVDHFQSIINHFNDELNQLSANLKNKIAARLQQEHTDRLTSAAATTAGEANRN